MGQDAQAAADRCRVVGAGLTCLSRVGRTRRQNIGKEWNCYSNHRDSSFPGSPGGHDGSTRSDNTASDGKATGSAR